MSNNLAKSSVILIAFTLLSKVLVVVRDMAMAAVLGASALSDAYVTATTILSLISVAALSSLTVSFIPIISGKNDQELNYVTNNFMTVLSGLTLILSGLAFFFTRGIVQLFASGFAEETIRQTEMILRIVLPLLFFNVILNITIAYLQHKGSFWYQGFSAVIANGIIIVSVLVCGRNLQILAVGYSLSIVVPALFGLALSRRRGLQVKPLFSVKNRYLGELLALSIPIFASQMMIQLNVIIDKNFCSQIGTGIVTNLDYAHKIANILIGTIIPSIATVLYPKMAQYAAEKNSKGFSDMIGRGLRVSTLLSFPMMAGTMLLSRPIINLLFLRGSYTVEAAGITSESLFYYSLGMLPLGLIYILNNGFFAIKDTKAPLFCGTLAITLNIVLNFALVGILSYRGLAIATSVSSVLNVILYLIWMKKKIGGNWVHDFAVSFCKIAMATGVMSGVVLLSKSILSSWFQNGGAWELLGCVVLAVLGGSVYAVTCLLLKEQSATDLVDIVRRRNGGGKV